MEPARHKCVLRIYSSDLSLPDLEEELGKSHKYCHDKGEPKRSGDLWGESQWSRDSPVASEWLEEQIAEHIAWLDAKVTEMPHILAPLSCDLYCTLVTKDGQTGVVVHRSLMSELDRLRVSVVLDVF